MWKLPDQDLEALMREFERSSWREMHLRMNGLELILAKDVPPVYREIPQNAARDTAPATQMPAHRPADSLELQPAAEVKAEPTVPSGWRLLRAPTLGTFYRSPKPGAPPFVRVGEEVTPATEVCLIEVMKLFTTVRSDVTGIVREIFATDAQLVEFDQPLFLLEAP